MDNDQGTYTALGYVNTDLTSEGHGKPAGSCRVLENKDQKDNSDRSQWKYNRLFATMLNHHSGETVTGASLGW